MKPKKQCRGTNVHGEPCRSRAVGKDGLCSAHRPGGHERMKRLGYEGAKAAHSPKGLDSDSLGDLETVRDAQRWLERIARGVVTGKLKPQEGTTGVRAIEAWLKAEQDRVAADDLAELRQQIADVRERLKDRPGLEVVR